MRRRAFLTGIFLALPSPGQERKESVRGRLIAGPAIQTPEGRVIRLEGDASTQGVLKDARLAGFEFEALGSFAGPDRFTIDPIHKRALFVYKDGRKLMVTYWCDVCSIRTYTPGICWCCQEETELDLVEPEK